MLVMAQVCGLCLLLVLMGVYGNHKKLKLYTGRAYIWLWSVNVLNLIIDIISVFLLDNMATVPTVLLNSINKLYLVTVMSVASTGLIYVCFDAYSDIKHYKKLISIIIAVFCVGTLLVMLLPINSVKTESGRVYTEGASVLVTYIVAVTYIIWNFVLMFMARNSMNRERRKSVLVWLSLWMFAAVIQFIFKEWLIVGFFSALGMMVIYLKLENQQSYMDKQTGFFNRTGFVELTRQLVNERKGRAMIFIKYPEELFAGQDDDNLAIREEIAGYLRSFSKALIFQNSYDEVILLFDERADAETAWIQIQKRFMSTWGSQRKFVVSVNGLLMPDMEIVAQVDELFYVVRYMMGTKAFQEKGSFLVIGAEHVEEAYQEQKIEKLITEALEEDRIVNFYQPIYSTEKKRFISAEALVRIQDKDGKLIPPGVFIEVAEKKGLILQLGERVFENVCRFIQRVNPESYGIDYLEVNLSVVQCAYEKLADIFIAYMEKYQVNPSYINLEITESASLTAKQNLLHNMDRLMKYGVRFSLDDFGTGQSNLNYIIEMPVDIVKFDRSMTNAYFENGKAKYVMNAAMQMIHGMNLEIVSEGIETREQFDRMEELGINYIQGYYFSKPLSEVEFVKFMNENNVVG